VTYPTDLSAGVHLDTYDRAIQTLYGVGLRLEGCLELLTPQSPEARAEIESVLSDIDGLITSIRERIYQLR
jgi:hypothetical protein